jgi:hypothetical protein
MPGGSRGELKGVVTGPPEAPTLDATVSLRGTSMTRFVGWATGNALLLDPRGDGTFGLRARLAISTGRVAVTNIIGDVAGTALNGDVRYRWERRPELTLVVDSPQLDLRQFVPAGASLTDILDIIRDGPPAAPHGAAALPADAPKSGWRTSQMDILMRVNAGQVVTGSRTFRDVALDLELKGGRLRLPLLRVAGDDGFSLELEGDLDRAASQPKGVLRGVASAESAQAFGPLTELLGIPPALRLGRLREKAMVPMRVAGSMTLGARAPASADLLLDGEISGATLNINARFDGGATGWRSGPLDLTAAVEAPDAVAVATLLDPAGPATSGGKPGRLLVRAKGIPAQGLATLAKMDAGGLVLGFRGQVIVADAGNSASGDLEIDAVDAARVAALAGLAPPLRFFGASAAGMLKVSAEPGKLAIEKLALKVGGVDVQGQFSLADAGERRRIEARLDIGEISVAQLLAPLLDQRLATAAAAEAAVSGQQSPWPDEPFDAGVLDGFEGNIRLNARRLLLSQGLGIAQAGIDIALEAGKIDVKRIEGACLAGRCRASLQIA